MEVANVNSGTQADAPVDINSMIERAGGSDEEIPVFNGPVYNLESAADLPQPVESSQRVECVEGDPNDPFSPKRYRVVTTHILPPVFIYSNAAAKRITAAAEQSGLIPEQPPCGELYVERVSPDSLAPWLLLLESKTPFVVHEVDPQHENTKSLANPQGILPTWVDADGSCVWGSHALMRFICDKHGLPCHFYPHDNLNLRGRVNIALDWCTTVLAPHVQQLLEPDAFERSDLHDAATAKLLLDKDLRVLINYFLQETQFIGGDKVCIADVSIAMHLLLLYATDYLPNAKVREYLHRCADFCDTWNDVTTSLRDYCIQRHHLRVRTHIEHEALKGHGDLQAKAETDERRQAELSERMRLEEEEWQRKLDEERRLPSCQFMQMAEEDRRKREEDARRRREEDERRAREDNERRRRAEKEWADRLDAEKRRLMEEDRRLREEEERRRRSLTDRRRQEEEERRRRLEEEERRRREAEEEERRRREEEERLRREAEDKAKGIEWKPIIGVEIKMLDDSAGNKDCVVVCHSITPDGPAQKAGMLAEDIIDAWNGEALRSKAAWTDHVKNSRPGAVVTLSIIRGGEKMEMPVTVGATMKNVGGVRTVKSSTQVGGSSKVTTTTTTTRTKVTGTKTTRVVKK